MNRVAKELATLRDGEAMRMPLGSMEVSLVNLRSAVARTMQNRGLRIATFCDGENLFLWKKTSATSKYERRSRKVKS
jgi:hypothetical protein